VTGIRSGSHTNLNSGIVTLASRERPYQVTVHPDSTSRTLLPSTGHKRATSNYFTRDSIYTPELDDLTIFFDGQAPNNGNDKDYFTYLPLITK
jgi:hypothetical protein